MVKVEGKVLTTEPVAIEDKKITQTTQSSGIDSYDEGSLSFLNPLTFSRSYAERIMTDAPLTVGEGTAESETSNLTTSNKLTGVEDENDPTLDGAANADQGSGKSANTPKIDIVKTPPNNGSNVTYIQGPFDFSNNDPSKFPSTKEFRDTIYDPNNYPLDAKFGPSPVLLACFKVGETADKFGPAPIAYQEIPRPGIGSKRHYVIAFETKEFTDTRVVIEWYAVSETYAKANFSDALKNDPSALYVPFVHGTWVYDLDTKTGAYNLDTDPGGDLWKWVFEQGKNIALTFPKYLFKSKWDMDIEIQ